MACTMVRAGDPRPILADHGRRRDPRTTCAIPRGVPAKPEHAGTLDDSDVPEKRNARRFIALVAGGFAILATLLGISAYNHKHQLLHHGVRTSGIVTESVEGISETIAFTTRDGQRIETRTGHSVYDSGMPFRVGTRVTLIYDPSSPTKIIDHPQHMLRLLLSGLLCGMLGPSLIIWGFAPAARRIKAEVIWFRIVRSGT
jgi:hypothetical protein